MKGERRGGDEGVHSTLELEGEIAKKVPGHAHMRLAALIHHSDREGGIDQVTPPSPPLAPLIERAYLHGYALAVHGSLHRDLDLIAVAWTDEADSPETLVDMLCQHEGLIHAGGKWTDKPHGRRAVTLLTRDRNKPIDLSIIPPVPSGDRAEAQGTELERLRTALDLAGRLAHPLYGGCDAMGEGGGCSECQRRASFPESAPMRHDKSGGKYRLVGRAEVQASHGPVAEGAVMVIYEGYDGRWWAREEREFAERFSTEEQWRERTALARPAAAAEAGAEGGEA